MKSPNISDPYSTTSTNSETKANTTHQNYEPLKSFGWGLGQLQSQLRDTMSFFPLKKKRKQETFVLHSPVLRESNKPAPGLSPTLDKVRDNRSSSFRPIGVPLIAKENELV